MEQIRAIIFDVGGTLIHPSVPVGETYARFGRKYGADLPGEQISAAFRRAFKSCTPREKHLVPHDGNDRAWWRRVVRLSVPEDLLGEATFEPFFEELYLYFAEPGAWTLFPEVPGVLDQLHAAGFQLAILSNWDSRLNPVLDALGFGRWITRRFISAELGVEKPDPAIYERVARELGLAPAQLLSVGDDLRNDVEAPRAAGWKVARVDRPGADLRVALTSAGLR